MNCAGRCMADLTGWLLDLYEDERRGAALWLIGDDGGRAPPAAGFSGRLSMPPANAPSLQACGAGCAATRFSRAWPKTSAATSFSPQPLTVLRIEMQNAARQPQLFREIAQRFPELDYYDADLAISLRHAARFGTFPLARCYVRADEDGLIQELRVLDSPWDLDPSKAPLRTLALRPGLRPGARRPAGAGRQPRRA